jgi:hypothetical protein
MQQASNHCALCGLPHAAGHRALGNMRANGVRTLDARCLGGSNTRLHESEGH